jgi:hypothetical protein
LGFPFGLCPINRFVGLGYGLPERALASAGGDSDRHGNRHSFGPKIVSEALGHCDRLLRRRERAQDQKLFATVPEGEV